MLQIEQHFFQGFINAKEDRTRREIIKQLKNYKLEHKVDIDENYFLNKVIKF